MSTGHQQQQHQQVNNHSSSSSSGGNTRGSWARHSKHVRKFPSQQSSQGSEQSLYQAQSQETPSERPVGPVMGIFFKVWSLVKANPPGAARPVTKGRHQRLRQQTSDEPGNCNFEYISGSHLPRSTFEPLDLPARQSTPKHRLQVGQSNPAQTPGTNSTSSGVSSGSSLRTRRRIDGYGPRRNTSEMVASGWQAKKASWTSRIRRSATSVNQADLRGDKWKRVPESNNYWPEERESAAAPAQSHSFSPARDEADEDSNNDIYSTPNDSIQSVPGSVPRNDQPSFLQQQQHLYQRQPPNQLEDNQASCHMTKSFSANNFSHLLKSQVSAAPSHFESIAETNSRHLAAADETKRRFGRIGHSHNNARFFISSSSSEDSNSAKQAGRLSSSRSEEDPQRHLVCAPPIAIEEGIHCHQPARPGTLALVPQQSPPITCGPMTPLELDLTRLESSRKRPLRPLVEQATDYANNWHQSKLNRIPNSISLFDCKMPIAATLGHHESSLAGASSDASTEFRLAEMLLESGSNPDARDEQGRSVLMLAVLSDNLPALKCLLERRAVPIDATDRAGSTALDLACSRKPSLVRLEVVRQLLANNAKLDGCAPTGRLLDRLIDQHQIFSPNEDRLPFVECLLQAGAKIGSSTWSSARGKLDVQLCLLTKLCQDGYYLYKENSLEAAVYRFEYALRRLAELEKELVVSSRSSSPLPPAARKLKHQVYLGLSRCERRRRFYKRALEFAHMAILIDSTAYEGFYSKAHILKESGHTDDALLAIHQTEWLLERTIDLARTDLADLEHRQEALVLASRLGGPLEPPTADWHRADLLGQLDYLEEARRFVGRLKSDIMDHKLRPDGIEQRVPLASGAQCDTSCA